MQKQVQKKKQELMKSDTWQQLKQFKTESQRKKQKVLLKFQKKPIGV